MIHHHPLIVVLQLLWSKETSRLSSWPEYELAHSYQHCRQRGWICGHLCDGSRCGWHLYHRARFCQAEERNTQRKRGTFGSFQSISSHCFKHVVLAATNADEGGPFVDHNPVVPHTVEGYLLNLFPLLSDKSLRRAVKAYSKVGSVLDQVIAIMNESERSLILLFDVNSSAVEGIFVCPSYYLLDAFSGAAFKGELAVPPAKHGDDIAYYFPSCAFHSPAANVR